MPGSNPGLQLFGAEAPGADLWLLWEGELPGWPRDTSAPSPATQVPCCVDREFWLRQGLPTHHTPGHQGDRSTRAHSCTLMDTHSPPQALWLQEAGLVLSPLS